MIFDFVIAEFGTVMVLLSAGEMVVEKRFIFSTVPLAPPASIKSPTLNGRKTMIRTAEPIFESESLSAKQQLKMQHL